METMHGNLHESIGPRNIAVLLAFCSGSFDSTNPMV
ncbi:hypothetical protein COLO4_12060 [Corchorus olitorius]|uniref:Uncharacterized protein n=1 Tax=Corchorus olitorius TaxID=93759 RepID=A0A1R3K2A4_9ROSI|nr:hypothetical protein COLO4_12060 [Corchorus olitorius]